MDQLLCFIVGAGSGVLGGLLGIGGGVLLTPVLNLYLGVPLHQAILTSLVTILATTSTIIATRVRTGIIHLPIGSLLEVGGVAGAFLGAYFSFVIEPRVAGLIFSVTLFAVGFLLVVQQVILPSDSNESDTTTFQKPSIFTAYYMNSIIAPKNPGLLFLLSIFAGASAGLLGIGGGVIIVPLMVLVGRIPFKMATVTSSYVMSLAALSAVLAYAKEVNPPEVIFIPTVLGGFFGAFVAKYMQFIGQKKLKIMFVILLFYLGVGLWIKHF